MALMNSELFVLTFNHNHHNYLEYNQNFKIGFKVVIT